MKLICKTVFFIFIISINSTYLASLPPSPGPEKKNKEKSFFTPRSTGSSDIYEFIDYGPIPVLVDERGKLADRLPSTAETERSENSSGETYLDVLTREIMFKVNYITNSDEREQVSGKWDKDQLYYADCVASFHGSSRDNARNSSAGFEIVKYLFSVEDNKNINSIKSSVSIDFSNYYLYLYEQGRICDLLHTMTIYYFLDSTVEWLKYYVEECNIDVNLTNSDGKTALDILTSEVIDKLVHNSNYPEKYFNNACEIAKILLNKSPSLSKNFFRNSFKLFSFRNVLLFKRALPYAKIHLAHLKINELNGSKKMLECWYSEKQHTATALVKQIILDILDEKLRFKELISVDYEILYIVLRRIYTLCD